MDNQDGVGATMSKQLFKTQKTLLTQSKSVYNVQIYVQTHCPNSYVHMHIQ